MKIVVLLSGNFPRQTPQSIAKACNRLGLKNGEFAVEFANTTAIERSIQVRHLEVLEANAILQTFELFVEGEALKVTQVTELV